jgi:hypothetical protein
MAIVVLILWAFTAGAGFYLLITSIPSRPALATPPPPTPAPATTSAARRTRDPWAPSSLVAAREAPVVPGARALAEFAHPAAGVIGLGFWLGFTLIHARVLGWIGFGLAVATACAGLAWFAANQRAARQREASQREASQRADSQPAASDGIAPQPAPAGAAPSFATRFVALHGSAAALTVALAALTALLLRP